MVSETTMTICRYQFSPQHTIACEASQIHRQIGTTERSDLLLMPVSEELPVLIHSVVHGEAYTITETATRMHHTRNREGWYVPRRPATAK
jgi:hypothetical protein